ncbi:branched-chain alpha-keto acid dehydrogenase subunit E2 [Mycolicibacter minnesotensis]|uniref:Dihydrolipoamide acetyltransferase component of pyruvate dehydrogenase complex n=1 Tax=Mycolicibacter minnesotensis TaxID=1118379 RepID=A0A7I7RA77_9MYCO|nr:dihydrolipoamide acetyltransferase family protein [Mycolicibacter minnesotensis]ORB04372.1 branched-chain alpha-keto acid dehydrogenase subunit E2 [Mycolicibacter minnesotensis]BBY34950.1 dihydrolipoyllysine-residue acyltransferase component of branched-chain alpha-ketoacid dehydrogenase complex [Mycolicibacter minnesotensis]
MSAESIKTFAVPDLGEGLTEVTLTCWNVAIGDQVDLNAVLCSVETAKAEVEIPSPFAGRVVELGGAVGEMLAVGAPLVRIETGPPAGPAVGRAPVLVGYGTDDTVDTSRRTCALSPARPKAKPGARKLAAELGIDLSRVQAGPGGVITADGVLAASGAASAGDELRPLSTVQAAMAQRMTLSRSVIPDAHGSVQVDGTRLLQLRDRFVGAGGGAVTPFVLILRLLVIALIRHPALNSAWVDTPEGPQICTHRALHLGFGVAAPRGLLVPVIVDAHRKTTRELAEAVARLIADARAGTLKPAELQGSTFTVSNFGALGLDDGVPVINYPEAAILGIGALKPRPAVVDDTVAVRQQLTLTCAFDHRVADGAQVAEFLCALRDLIEQPEMALLDL